MGFNDQRCAVHDVALRPDGTCVLCQRGRPRVSAPANASAPASASASGAPVRASQRVQPYEREPNRLGTALLGLLFVLSVAFCVWWFVSPETLKALFE